MFPQVRHADSPAFSCTLQILHCCFRWVLKPHLILPSALALSHSDLNKLWGNVVSVLSLFPWLTPVQVMLQDAPDISWGLEIRWILQVTVLDMICHWVVARRVVDCHKVSEFSNSLAKLIKAALKVMITHTVYQLISCCWMSEPSHLSCRLL